MLLADHLTYLICGLRSAMWMSHICSRFFLLVLNYVDKRTNNLSQLFDQLLRSRLHHSPPLSLSLSFPFFLCSLSSPPSSPPLFPSPPPPSATGSLPLGSLVRDQRSDFISVIVRKEGPAPSCSRIVALSFSTL